MKIIPEISERDVRLMFESCGYAVAVRRREPAPGQTCSFSVTFWDGKIGHIFRTKKKPVLPQTDSQRQRLAGTTRAGAKFSPRVCGRVLKIGRAHV